MKKIYGPSSITYHLNKAYQGLNTVFDAVTIAFDAIKALCDPACEGSPYVSISQDMSRSEVRKPIFSFRLRRMGWR